jgi:hypothetical protein
MRSRSKCFSSLLLILLLAISFGSLIVKPTSAQSIPMPSVPEFSFAEVAHPFDVPTIYYKDPSTGENITYPGYHSENKTTLLMIRNQPYTHQLSNGTQVNLYYQVRLKYHYEENWHFQFFDPFDYPMQSNEEYTLVPLRLYSLNIYTIEKGTKWDVEVQALIGRIEFFKGQEGGFGDYYAFSGVSGNWSKPQTLTVGQPLPSITTSSSTPTPTTSVPEFPILAIISLLGAILIGTVIVKIKKNILLVK